MSSPGERINVYSVPVHSVGTHTHIGALLVDSGKISQEDADRIMRMQRESGIRFGDAAVKLGLITPANIERALTQQFEFPYLIPGTSGLSGELVTAYAPFDSKAEVFKGVRSQLMLRWFNIDLGNKHLAIVSPCRGEGRSYLAANLAIVFSQLGERTLLVDADMRNPRQHAIFDLDNRVGLSSLLAGRAETDIIQRILPFADLSVLPAGPIPPNPQELLGRPIFRKLLGGLTKDYDVIILDTPAGADNADAQAIATCAGGAFAVARRHRTPARTLKAFASQLAGSGTTLVGAVINTI